MSAPLPSNDDCDQRCPSVFEFTCPYCGIHTDWFHGQDHLRPTALCRLKSLGYEGDLYCQDCDESLAPLIWKTLYLEFMRKTTDRDKFIEINDISVIPNDEIEELIDWANKNQGKMPAAHTKCIRK